ncbi:hypothetical protein ICN48_06350 [Polynucleobacter sp. JS-Safj-400b-B2]|uniref:hypothetical protein n=1 Tax=Polynucleobacter sp. JS-Safj-400b-B2 TaxID=2576921 RepID=UPI001C0E62A4|nr:hypothetical protein [Polynucleobacter sp. JS-Safj-400b-B2]MBU3625853.1 hypothetical protein [Polynucleobacter sp. JS-Safj-400b-B2]
MNDIHDEVKHRTDVVILKEDEQFGKRLAKAAFGLVVNDFRRYSESKGLNKDQQKFADMFGFVTLSETKRLFFDSLIWVFELHESEPTISFSYACEVLGRDARSFQQCTANALQNELIELVQTIEITCGKVSAKCAADKIAEFISLDRKVTQ